MNRGRRITKGAITMSKKTFTPSDLFNLITDRMDMDEERYYKLLPGNGGEYFSEAYVKDINQFSVTLEIPEDDDPVLTIKVKAYMPILSKMDLYTCGLIVGHEEDLDYLLNLAEVIIPVGRKIVDENKAVFSLTADEMDAADRR